MASTGMQFTEQELNMMYQQQMVAQQAYKQWVATLSIEQQGQLHARMQANMQQVQQGMAAMMQNILKSSAEASTTTDYHRLADLFPFALPFSHPYAYPTSNSAVVQHSHLISTNYDI